MADLIAEYKAAERPDYVSWGPSSSGGSSGGSSSVSGAASGAAMVSAGGAGAGRSAASGGVRGEYGGDPRMARQSFA